MASTSPLILSSQAAVGNLLYLNMQYSKDLNIPYQNDGQKINLDINKLRASYHYSRYDSDHRNWLDKIPQNATLPLLGTGYGWWEVI